jgi:hypothetical protein
LAKHKGAFNLSCLRRRVMIRFYVTVIAPVTMVYPSLPLAAQAQGGLVICISVCNIDLAPVK